ncbi:F-box/FBD/LRR-repeat protein [Trifolium pratense]|uniref:F-box/FBD/LRR-repeat protein n=1 Tax=Trifolium pratense TaxID=57577 RepID=A0A2K3PKN6_TRIPR|nr:F-box/FBD/LRR-repeat protein [Trifolium pratense]
MSLFNKKGNQDDQIDRISDLPSNVIDGVLEHLNIRDVVRTSILSTKWRYMWTSAPRLEFHPNFFHTYEYIHYPSPVVSKIITDVLMRHNGPINKFLLFIPTYFNFKLTVKLLDMWIPLLSRRGVKHLELLNLETALSHLPYIVFSCALESLISGCPLLEKLSIEYCHRFEYFHISTPTLKVLSLGFDKNMKSICLKKAQNLSDLTLMANDGWVPGLIKSLPKNIQRFSIGSSFNKKIPYADIIPPTLVKSSFNSIKYLKLRAVKFNERGELLYIVSVLKSAPRLVELVIESYGHLDITQGSDCSEELDCSSRCLHQLKTVNINIYATSHQHAMSFIQFILANSTSLKTLTFDVRLESRELGAPMLLSISQHLLLMKRASQSAQVKFIH